MAGKSCQNCIFSQWSDQNMTGCLLGRAEKYGYSKILNDENNGFYWIIPDRICPAFRTKAFLQKNPRNPAEVVRKELYPKVQLIIVIRDNYKQWNNQFIIDDFSKYNVVDVLVFDNQQSMLANFNSLLKHRNFFLHTCYEKLEYHLNNVVRDDCDFYVVASNCSGEYSEIPDLIDEHINERLLALALVEPCEDYDNMIVYTPLHTKYYGYGTQTVPEKIKIDSVNNEYTEAVFGSLDEFFKTVTAKNELVDPVGLYNIEDKQ